MLWLLYPFFSCILVACGQPASLWPLGLAAGMGGYGLFFRWSIEVPSAWHRLWWGTCWFAAVQVVQLQWLWSHPYAYAYGLHLFLALWLGLQFGLLTALVTKERLQNRWMLWGISGFWVLLEWSRLFFLSGFSFNPIGLSLTVTQVGLQLASVGGVYGLSFWVMGTNLAFTRLLLRKKGAFICWGVLASAPFLFGFWHLEHHKEPLAKAKKLPVLLVQTAFPIEEGLPFASFEEAVLYVQKEWQQIIELLRPYEEKTVALVALPEYVVPYGTYIPLYDHKVIATWFPHWAMAAVEPPLATFEEGRWKVSNGYICQTIANWLHADCVVGLQENQWVEENELHSYSAALYFWPQGKRGWRQEKQVLVPMGEYIPFDFLKNIALKYGIGGSFTPGSHSRVFVGTHVPFNCSICYEETYGHLMTQAKRNGAELLINVTSDVWYPNSSLAQQHFDHARLRSVECGVPLVRACNTGITAAVDSLGGIVAATAPEDEWKAQALYAWVPLYHYRTLYSMWGDWPILLVSLGSLCAVLLHFFRQSRLHPL